MKKTIYILILFIWSCGGGSDDSSTPEVTNEAPTIPVLLYPSNNLLCIENTINFQWNPSTDINNDFIDYTIQVSTDNEFNSIYSSLNVSLTSNSLTLDRGVAYYWRVKATDSNDASSNYSPTFNFYTEGDGVSNHFPFSPELISPSLYAQVNEGSINLEWLASDTDGDALAFDVYFGTENPPQDLVSQDQTGFYLSVETASGTDYYWKVVVKDDNGAQTIGQVWSFNTN